VSRPTNWIDALQYCSIAALQHCSIAALQHCSIAALQHCSIAALQQMESMWNEVNNGPLNDFWQGSDLEMLISSWDTREVRIHQHG
jgi:hypothetical protein